MSDSPSKKKRWQAKQEFRSSHTEAEEALLSERKLKYDPSATAEDCLADLRSLQQRNPDAYITRRFYRKHGTYSDSTWDSRFGTFHEFRRQAGLELSRGQGTLEKQIAKHASLDTRRGFMEVEVLPWNGKYERKHDGRWKTMLAGGDFHDQETDPFALEVFLDTCYRVKPDIISLTGDVFDSYEFSRFDKDPRRWDAAGRMAWVRDNLFAKIRESCPDAQIDLIAGNHEHHLLRHMSERTPELRTILSDFMGITFADMLGLSKFEINLVCQHDLTAFRESDIRNEMKKNRKTYFKCVTINHYPDDKFNFGTNWLAGHTHKPRLVTSCNEILGSLWGATLGCMARIDNSYTDVNKNQNGFALVHFDTHNNNAAIEPIIFTDTSCMVGGTRYTRK